MYGLDILKGLGQAYLHGSINILFLIANVLLCTWLVEMHCHASCEGGRECDSEPIMLAVCAQSRRHHTTATGRVCTDASPNQQGEKYVAFVHDVSSTCRIHRQQFIKSNITWCYVGIITKWLPRIWLGMADVCESATQLAATSHN